MAFHEVRFPDNISRGARGGPERRTQIVELASGDEERNASWANSRRRYDVAYGIRRADDLAAVISFFEARNGRLHGFRFKDWGDHKSCLPSGTLSPSDQAIGTGDGTTTAFQLVKRYASGAQSWTRAIAKPVAGSVRIALSGVEQPSGWSVDTATGVVTFSAAPGAGVAITAGFEFDVPVRFDTDVLDVKGGDPIRVAHCWAHARRKLKEVFDRDGSEIAAEGLRRIAEFYAVEADIRGIEPGQRLSAREVRTAPLVAAFGHWLQEQRLRVSAKSRLGEKLAYIHRHWDGLQTFLHDGRVEIDSNSVENLIRPIALNRKNALFAGHDEGGKAWGRIASLIETAKINGVEPFA